MNKIADSIIDTVDAFIAWAGSAVKQTTESYCELQTADSPPGCRPRADLHRTSQAPSPSYRRRPC